MQMQVRYSSPKVKTWDYEIFPFIIYSRTFTCTQTFPSQTKGSINPACLNIEVTRQWNYITMKLKFSY